MLPEYNYGPITGFPVIIILPRKVTDDFSTHHLSDHRLKIILRRSFSGILPVKMFGVSCVFEKEQF